MSLISAEQIATTLNIHRYGRVGIDISKLLMTFLKISNINELHKRYDYLEGLSFINAILDDLGIEVNIDKTDLEKLPKDKPFILVSNHPQGAIDGLIVIKIMLETNPNSKVLANFLLSKIDAIKDHIIPVNPFENTDSKNISGLRKTIKHLKEGYPLAIFPAGEVSTRKYKFLGKIKDIPWKENIGKILELAEMPVYPIFFDIKNSHLFYFLSGLNDKLRTASLPSEVLKSRNKLVKIKIGSPISVEKQKEIGGAKSLADYLMNLTYLLEKKDFIKNKKHISQTKYSTEIAWDKVNFYNIKSEIEELRLNGKFLFESGNYEVFCSTLNLNSNLLKCIGCHREEVFRQAGEGTNKQIDLDVYDGYYHHLILWDKQENLVAGAYRISFNKDVFKEKGIQGLYMSSLFHFDEKMNAILEQSMEIGRAFIVKDYQNKPLPLYLLWKGLARISYNNRDNYSYLMGAASISNSYSELTKSIMVSYFQKYFNDEKLSKLVKPKKAFNSILQKDELYFLNCLGVNHIKEIDNMVMGFSRMNFKMPILIKKYLAQNAKFLSFNIDPNFNDAIDGLMYININDIDKKLLE